MKLTDRSKRELWLGSNHLSYTNVRAWKDIHGIFYPTSSSSSSSTGATSADPTSTGDDSASLASASATSQPDEGRDTPKSDIFTKKWTPYCLENPKSPACYSHLPGKEDISIILTALRGEHIKLRKTLVVGFSDRAMREHEKVIKGYVDVLIRS